MSHLATAIAIRLSIAQVRAAADHHSADAWRRLPRRPDALPEPMPIAPAARRRRFAALRHAGRIARRLEADHDTGGVPLSGTGAPVMIPP